MKNEALSWLNEALWDLDTDKILHREKRYNAIAFYAHQAARKPVKPSYTTFTKCPGGTV